MDESNALKLQLGVARLLPTWEERRESMMVVPGWSRIANHEVRHAVMDVILGHMVLFVTVDPLELAKKGYLSTPGFCSSTSDKLSPRHVAMVAAASGAAGENGRSGDNEQFEAAVGYHIAETNPDATPEEQLALIKVEMLRITDDTKDMLGDDSIKLAISAGEEALLSKGTLTGNELWKVISRYVEEYWKRRQDDSRDTVNGTNQLHV